VARMMDSLILDPFSPFTFTKITTTHRPVRDSGSKRSTGTQHHRQKAAPVRAQHPPEQGEGPSMMSLHCSEPQWSAKRLRIIVTADHVGVPRASVSREKVATNTGTLFYLATHIALHSHCFSWLQTAQRSPLLQYAVSQGPRLFNSMYRSEHYVATRHI
jgi:hypothetical protein